MDASQALAVVRSLANGVDTNIKNAAFVESERPRFCGLCRVMKGRKNAALCGFGFLPRCSHEQMIHVTITASVLFGANELLVFQSVERPLNGIDRVAEFTGHPVLPGIA